MVNGSYQPFSICSYDMCKRLTRDRYCDEHKEIAEEQDRARELQRYKDYNKYSRNKKYQAFYVSREWRTLTAYIKARDNNLCQICLKDSKITKADVTDHIVPIEIDWSLRLDEKNCWRLCHSCHDKKTRDDKRKYKNFKGV